MKFGRPYQAIYRERMGDGILSLHICGKTNDIIEGMATTGCEMLELDHQNDVVRASASGHRWPTGNPIVCRSISAGTVRLALPPSPTRSSAVTSDCQSGLSVSMTCPSNSR